MENTKSPEILVFLLSPRRVTSSGFFLYVFFVVFCVFAVLVFSTFHLQWFENAFFRLL